MLKRKNGREGRRGREKERERKKEKESKKEKKEREKDRKRERVMLCFTILKPLAYNLFGLGILA